MRQWGRSPCVFCRLEIKYLLIPMMPNAVMEIMYTNIILTCLYRQKWLTSTEFGRGLEFSLDYHKYAHSQAFHISTLHLIPTLGPTALNGLPLVELTIDFPSLSEPTAALAGVDIRSFFYELH